MDTDESIETDRMEAVEAVEAAGADRREEVEAAEAVETDRREEVEATATGAIDETVECDSCYAEAPVRQMTVTRGSLVCASCVTARAAYVLSCFHLRSPTTTKTTKTTKMKKKKSATRR
jgi:hypothetical protein